MRQNRLDFSTTTSKQTSKLKIREVETINPAFTQEQNANYENFSDSTIERYRGDINMDNPYERNNIKKKKNCHRPSVISQ